MEQWKQRLKSAREAKGYKKIAFARAVKVSHPTITDWEKSTETGGIRELSGSNLMKVCEALGITPEWLYHGTEPEPATPAPIQDSLQLVVRTAEELRLLTAYRIADDAGKRALDGATNVILDRMQSAARNKR